MDSVAGGAEESLPGFGDFVLDTVDERLIGPKGPVHLGRKSFQVLALLVAQPGRLIPKETLFETVWRGVHVSESVLTVAIKELRKALGDQAKNPKFIVSVYGRGYRFVAPIVSVRRANVAFPPMRASGADESFPARRIGRRTLIAGTAVLGAAGLASSTIMWLRSDRPSAKPSPEVEALVMRARDALEGSGDDDQDQAIALMRRVAALSPRYADGWALLGLANAVASHFRERALGLNLRARAEAAARRALDIDPHNGLGELALGVALPLVGAWSVRERHLERALARAPSTEEVLEYTAVCKIFNGQASDALPLYDRMRRPFQPQTFANYAQALWRTGQLEELDRALDEAASLYPAQPRVWFNQLGIYLFSDRVDRALEMIRQPVGRPRSVDAESIAELEEVAGAIRNPRSALADKVVAKQVRHERRIGAATEAVRVLASLGRIDAAFAVVDALYFGKGYLVADHYGAPDAFTPEQRDSRVLFEPATRLIRADPRFEGVVSKLGLDSFWRVNRISPDYRRHGSLG